MKLLRSGTIKQADICEGQFNNCEHLFMEVEAGKYQTISVRLPNKEFVTFAFVPGQGLEMECVDIHSTVGQKFEDHRTLEKVHFIQQAIGFSFGSDTFDTREIGKPTTLITLLLGAQHHKTTNEDNKTRPGRSAGRGVHAEQHGD